jgi:NTP pyrophosphatase (non-canonical NTP hydrolase)
MTRLKNDGPRLVTLRRPRERTDDHDTLQTLTATAAEFRDARDWRQFHTLKEMILSLSLEASELLELTQWRDGETLETHASANRARFGEELSDILYWTLLIAKELDLDLRLAFREKMAKNEAKYPIEHARGSRRKYDELPTNRSS